MSHELYTPADFNQAERERRNTVYVMVVEGGLDICKRCGAAEAEIEMHPTCADFRREVKRRQEIGL